MSVDKAKEFLIDVTEDEAAASKIQARYLDTLLSVSKELGYDLTSDDISIAIEEMSGLGEVGDDVEGFALNASGVFLDSFTWVRGPSMGVIANPLGLGGMGGHHRPGGPGLQRP